MATERPEQQMYFVDSNQALIKFGRFGGLALIIINNEFHRQLFVICLHRDTTTVVYLFGPAMT